MDAMKTVDVYNANRKIARIQLEDDERKLRAFRLVDGNLVGVWERQTIVKVNGSGKSRRARVAALPAEEGANGLIEML